MTSQNLKPSPPLDVVVHHYHIIEYPEGFPEGGCALVPPSLATGLFFIYFMDEPIRIKIGGRGEYLPYSHAHLISPTLSPIHHNIPGAGGMIRVIFHPGRLHQLLGIPLNEFIGLLIHAEDILGQALRDLQSKIVEASDNTQRLMLIENFLLQKLRFKSSTINLIEAANRFLLSDPNFSSVEKLAGELYVSTRTLERRFNELTGMAPKDYLSILRFCRALERIHAPQRPKLTTIAIESGYFDQPHFNREFRRFMGMSPGAYRKMVSVLFTSSGDVTHQGVVMGEKA